MDECITLWTKILIAEAVHDNNIVQNVTRIEHRCNTWLEEQIQALDSLLGAAELHELVPVYEDSSQFISPMFAINNKPPHRPDASTDAFRSPDQPRVLNESFKKLYRTVPRPQTASADVAPGDAAPRLRTVSDAKPSTSKPQREILHNSAPPRPAVPRSLLQASSLQGFASPSPTSFSLSGRPSQGLAASRSATSASKEGRGRRRAWQPAVTAARESTLVCYPLFDLSPPHVTEPADRSSAASPADHCHYRITGTGASSSSSQFSETDSDSDLWASSRTSPGKPETEYASDQYLRGLLEQRASTGK